MWFTEKRQQRVRNRAKAKALVDELGDGAMAHVRLQLEASAWEIRNRAHWERIDKHVRALLRRRA